MNFKVPELLNEEIKDYKKNSKERLEVEKTYDNLYNQNIKIPLYIGNEEIYTKSRKEIFPPHDNKKSVGSFSICDEKHVHDCLLYTSPSPRDMRRSRMPSSA